jgi:hypothetical protein
MNQRRSRARLLAVYGGIALAVLLVALAERFVDQRTPPGVLEAPSAAPLAERNPLPLDVRTVFAGSQLAQFYCAGCHANQPYHTVSEQTADGELYHTIATGPPNNTGHRFDSQLTSEQIWQLVAYLRTLQQSSAVTPLAVLGTREPGVPDSGVTIRDQPEQLPPLVFARGGAIWRSPGDATALQQLATPTSDMYADHPVYSAAAGRVAFTRTSPVDGGALITMRLDGGEQRVLWQADSGSFSMPAWTADGAALLVTYTGPSFTGEPYAEWRPQIVRVELASGERRTIVTGAHSPALARDGRTLAFVRVDASRLRSSIVVAGVDGGNPREVLGGDAFAGFFAPRFSADGGTIVVAAIGGPASGIFPDGAMPALASLFAPRIASAHVTPPWDLWAVDVAGSGARRLATLQEDLPMAAFSPAGDEIIVMATRGLYRMRSDGSELRRISLLGDHGALDWVR